LRLQMPFKQPRVGGSRWQLLAVFQIDMLSDSTLALSQLLSRVLNRCCLDAAAHGPS
jgi:hypothetical protein